MTRDEAQYVDPVEIERELAAIWSSIDGHQDGTTVMRASMSNVMIFCDGEEQAMDAAERIPQLVMHHPARVLVLALIDNHDSQDVDAWVSAHCRKTQDGTQLCAEHIELRFAEAGAARCASVVRSLLISDLPTALWWLSSRPPALTGDIFDAFAPLARQIIYDSVGWADPPRGIEAMIQWSRNHSTVIFNLAWRRLKPWRRMLAQSLAPTVVPGALQRIHEIELHHGPHALPLAWLLIGWLASRLDWQPVEARAERGNLFTWQLESAGGPIRIRLRRSDEGPPHVTQMRIAWRDEKGRPEGHIDYTHEGHHIRQLPSDDTLLPSSTPTIDMRIEEMVAAQLAHRAGDRLFTTLMSFSESLAKVIR